jgi:hypothetical protein
MKLINSFFLKENSEALSNVKCYAKSYTNKCDTGGLPVTHVVQYIYK